jgi:phosphatidate cytidylyltransferase
MLWQRVAAAIVGVPALLGVIALGGVGFAIAVGAVLAMAALEFYAVVDPRPAAGAAAARPQAGLARLLAQRPLGYLGVAFTALLVAAAYRGEDWWAASLALLMLLAFLWLAWRGETEQALSHWLITVGGVAYVGFLGSHLIFLRDLPNGRDWVMLAVLATFAADSAAYFVGRVVGRTKLAPRISPGKTVEGTAGGLLVGAVAIVFLNWALGLREDAALIGPLALLLPLTAAIGDLGESLVKRGAGVKDASALIPGHGGLLDRLDSVLFTAVLIYYYVQWVVLP